jgi:hypothetical protein
MTTIDNLRMTDLFKNATWEGDAATPNFDVDEKLANMADSGRRKWPQKWKKIVC